MTTPTSTTFIGDCRDILGMFYEDNTFDSIVTDPPYGLGFMGKDWDHSVPGVAFWQEMLRVLKPGGHLLSFSGSRTYHRMVCAIEDAGFEIRDQIMWVYGSGFPKSLDVSKAIDKAAGAERVVVGVAKGAGMAINKSASAAGTFRDDNWTPEGPDLAITAPATDAAKQWQGWGTALKPAHEPICVARKPLIGTVAANVLQFGTGGLNIDACRVVTDLGGRPLREVAPLRSDVVYKGNALAGRVDGSLGSSKAVGLTDTGRWPANLIHDGGDEVVALFPDTGKSTGGGKNNGDKFGGGYAPDGQDTIGFGDSGSAARFFYCAKASRKDRNEGLSGFVQKQQDESRKVGDVGGDNPRNRGIQGRENHHPTVKPTELMAYLCRLVTPPGGLILDPFMGSGSTGKAALREGFSFVGIDLDGAYVAIADARMAA